MKETQRIIEQIGDFGERLVDEYYGDCNTGSFDDLQPYLLKLGVIGPKDTTAQRCLDGHYIKHEPVTDDIALLFQQTKTTQYLEEDNLFRFTWKEQQKRNLEFFQIQITNAPFDSNELVDIKIITNFWLVNTESIYCADMYDVLKNVKIKNNCAYVKGCFWEMRPLHVKEKNVLKGLFKEKRRLQNGQFDFGF